MAQSLAKLNGIANSLYDQHLGGQIWLDTFSPLELAKLWYEYCVYSTDENGKTVSPQAYDDEVYDALAVLGYWDMV